MRILHVTPFFSPHIGGVERHGLEVSRCLAEKGLSERETIGRVRIIRAPFWGMGYFSRLFSAWWFVIRNWKEFREFDITHLHDFPAFVWALPLFGKRAITFHGFEHDPPKFYNKLLRKLAEKSVGSVFCVGKYLRRIYGTRCLDKNIIVGGVEWKRFSGNRKRIRNKIVFLRRLEGDNHPLECIEALSGTGIGIDFYGKGSLVAKARAFSVERGVSARFFGETKHPENILPRYELAFASKQLAILESLASGCAVFSLHSSNLQKELLKGMGLPRKVVADFLVSDIKKAGREISARMISGGGTGSGISFRRRLARKFGWEKVADTYEREYLRLFNDLP